MKKMKKDYVPVIAFGAALLLFVTCVGVQVLPLHVDAVPAAAALESVYPILQVLQSTCSAVSHSVPALPSNTVATPFGQVHPHSISSLFSVVDVQVEQEFCIENGCVVGDDMYLLAGQQPYRAVLLPRV